MIFILTISCVNNPKEKKLSGEYPKPFSLHRELLEVDGSGIILGSDKHEYLVIDNSTNTQTIEHYIECKLSDLKYGDVFILKEDTKEDIEVFDF